MRTTEIIEICTEGEAVTVSRTVTRPGSTREVNPGKDGDGRTGILEIEKEVGVRGDGESERAPAENWLLTA